MTTQIPSITPGEGALQAALASADEGAELRLAAGRYLGPFVVERSVRLVSDGSGEVILQGAGRGALIVVQPEKPTRLALFGLVLAGGGDTKAGGAIRVASEASLVLDGCVVRDCAAHGYGGGGLFMRRGEAHLHQCRFERCTARSGGALLITNDAKLKAVDCTFVGCEAAHAGALVAVRDRAVVELVACDASACAAPEVVADDLGWLVDVQVRGAVSTVDRCRGADRPGALHSREPGTLRRIGVR